MRLTKAERAVLAKLGRIGGKKSKRKITPDEQAKLQAARVAARAKKEKKV